MIELNKFHQLRITTLELDVKHVDGKVCRLFGEHGQESGGGGG